MTKKILAGLVAALVLGAVLAPAAQATGYSPTPGALFNRPNGTYEGKWRLMTHVDHAIEHTPPKATILISTYLLDRQTSVDKLLAAHSRGVAIQVIMDHLIATHQADRLMHALNADNDNGPPAPGFTSLDTRGGPDNSYAYKCHGSCRGNGGNMHIKVFAFSQTGTASNVVMVSSANLNKGGATLGWNDLYTVVGRTAMYDRYEAIHKEMRDDTSLDDSYVTYQDSEYLSRFFPMRTADRTTDPTMRDLAKVHCKGADGGAGFYGRTAINIAMFRWSDTRGMYIAHRLLDLQKQGCLISIIYGAPSKELATLLKKAANAGRINLYDSRFDRNGDHVPDLRVHSKYMLINGHFGSDTSSWQVFTGSRNWGKGSLTDSDELEVNIASHGAYAKYRQNWDDIRMYGSRKLG